MATTIIDSNVIIDLVEPVSPWIEWSRQQIASALYQGKLIFNIVIAAEVAREFVRAERYDCVFVSTLWTFEDIPLEAARIAGRAHREYQAQGGKRDQTLPDLLIGAHASVSGHKLLTRDVRRYRAYFPDLEIISPDTHP